MPESLVLLERHEEVVVAVEGTGSRLAAYIRRRYEQLSEVPVQRAPRLAAAAVPLVS
jgi:hypothetical protein